MGAFLIRLVREDDAAGIARIYAPMVEQTIISFETVTPEPEELADRIRKTVRVYPWLVCDTGGVVAGYAYASRHRVRAAYQWSVDVSVYVSEEFRRRGIARALYASLFRILAAQGFVSAFAGIALPNPASIALHESVGFVPVGVYRRVGFKLGAWRDTGWWQRAIAEAGDSPVEPASMHDVEARDEWPALLAYGERLIR